MPAAAEFNAINLTYNACRRRARTAAIQLLQQLLLTWPPASLSWRWQGLLGRVWTYTFLVRQLHALLAAAGSGA